VLVSRLARREVTVSLSGDAGDELFWGYRVYRYADAVRRSLRWVPRAARGAGARALQAARLPPWRWVLDRVERVVPRWVRGRRGLALRVDAFAEILGTDGSDAELYRMLVSRWKRPADVVPGAHEPPTAFTDARAWPERTGFDDWMMFVDAVTYLPDDILVKVDRATMSVGLEARVPLLDHRLVELAWRLPLALKRRGDASKWVLRQILYRHVPRALVERPKMGFGVPIGAWLRGPLRAWAEDLLDERSLRRDGYLDPAPVRAKLADHLSSPRDLSADLWNVLMFQAWLREWSGPVPSRPARRAWEPSASAAT
jgi:asparagine synthase (glutamine-hydrolysing)